MNAHESVTPPAEFTPDQAAAFRTGVRDAQETGPLDPADAHRLRVLLLGVDYAHTRKAGAA